MCTHIYVYGRGVAVGSLHTDNVENDLYNKIITPHFHNIDTITKHTFNLNDDVQTSRKSRRRPLLCSQSSLLTRRLRTTTLLKITKTKS